MVDHHGIFKMHLLRPYLLLLWLATHAPLAAAVSDAPLQAINTYIEHTGNCPAQLVEWNRRYSKETLTGATTRDFYYRVLSFSDWGDCGRPFLRSILVELQRAWIFFTKGIVSEVEFEAKERELVELFFAAVKDGKQGASMVRAYEAAIAARLNDLDPPRQYFSCTYFGQRPYCLD